jgi:hypothetical protein
MKNYFSKMLCLSFGLITTCTFAQTAGTLTFTYTPTSHTCYIAQKNVLAIWIQDANGAFIQTRLRNVGSGTNDHLPTWAVNSGGSSANCLSASCNVVNATTGATLTSFTAKTVTWNGKDVNGNVVPDGVYKVTIQSTWNHGTSGTATKSFSFTKGSTADNPAFTDDANFTGISLNWVPSSLALAENTLEGVKVYPVPSKDGMITVEYVKASQISIYNAQGILVKEQAIETADGKTTLDLSAFGNGTYILLVTDGKFTSKQAIVIGK